MIVDGIQHMRVLITGADGFTGRYLATELKAGGHEVYGIARNNIVVKGFDVMKAADLLDPPSLLKVLEERHVKEQIEKGITPQIEGLLEEGKLLAKLKELFQHDKFEHPGKRGDIIQSVIEQGKEIGKIVYECKKVKTFNKQQA